MHYKRNRGAQCSLEVFPWSSSCTVACLSAARLQGRLQSPRLHPVVGVNSVPGTRELQHTTQTVQISSLLYGRHEPSDLLVIIEVYKTVYCVHTPSSCTRPPLVLHFLSSSFSSCLKTGLSDAYFPYEEFPVLRLDQGGMTDGRL